MVNSSNRKFWKRVGLMLSLQFLNLLILAQSTASCDELLKKGMYNNTVMSNSGNFTNDVKNWLISDNFREYIANRGGGFNIGIPIDGFPLNFGFDSKATDFESLKQSLNSGGLTKFNSNHAEYIAQQIISKDVLQSWEKCITQNSQKTGLQVLVEGDLTGETFFMKVFFSPRLGINQCTLDRPIILGAKYDTTLLARGRVVNSEILTIPIQRIENSAITIAINSYGMGSYSQFIKSNKYASINETVIGSIKIGSQIWMTENLNVDTFRNGDKIINPKTNIDWNNFGDQKQPAWCYYNSDPSKNYIYGKLYNWYVVVDARGLCPIGWHIPTDQEWELLSMTLGGPSKANEALKSTMNWDNIPTGPNGPPKKGSGTNISGFSGVAAGHRQGVPDNDLNGNSPFIGIGNSASYWSATPLSEIQTPNDGSIDVSFIPKCACGFGLNNFPSPPPPGFEPKTHRLIDLKCSGLSVRCIKD